MYLTVNKTMTAPLDVLDTGSFIVQIAGRKTFNAIQKIHQLTTLHRVEYNQHLLTRTAPRPSTQARLN